MATAYLNLLARFKLLVQLQYESEAEKTSYDTSDENSTIIRQSHDFATHKISRLSNDIIEYLFPFFKNMDHLINACLTHHDESYNPVTEVLNHYYRYI